MSSPVWNKRPEITQSGNKLSLADRGDWTTQEGSYPARTCVLWQRQLGGGGWENVGGSVAPQRTRPEDVLPGESAGMLKIGPENAGRKFRAQVWAGVQSDEWDDGSWVEWGSDRSTRPTPPEYAFSDVLTVQPFGQTPPPTVPSAADIRKVMIETAKLWQNKQLGPTPLARITVAREILDLKDERWNAVREGVRALLQDEGE